MEIFITAYSKSMPDHNIFMGTLKADDIKDNPSPSFLDGKLRCSVAKSDSFYADACRRLCTAGDERFEPIFRMTLAAELRLNGNYRVHHIFRKSEIITMLASVLKKSELSDVVRLLNDLVED